MGVIACLHTASSNVAVFDAACPHGVVLRHAVRPDLLMQAELEGGVTEALLARTAEALVVLADGATAALLTCSTLGAAAGRAAAGVPVLRADAALAGAARRIAGRVAVLCAAATTLEPTRALFGDASGRMKVELVPGAWALFRAGDLAAYHRRIAEAADAAYATGCDAVALAQASMAGAAPLCRRGQPLTSPAAALHAVARAIR